MSKSPESRKTKEKTSFSFSGIVIMGLAALNIVVLGGSMVVSPEVSQSAAWENAKFTTLLLDIVAMGLGSHMLDMGQG